MYISNYLCKKLKDKYPNLDIYNHSSDILRVNMFSVNLITGEVTLNYNKLGIKSIEDHIIYTLELNKRTEEEDF